MWSHDLHCKNLIHTERVSGVLFAIFCFALNQTANCFSSRGVETKPLRRRFLPRPITIEIRIHCRVALAQREMERHFFANRWARASFLRPEDLHFARGASWIPNSPGEKLRLLLLERGAFLLSLGERRVHSSIINCSVSRAAKSGSHLRDRKRRRIFASAINNTVPTTHSWISRLRAHSWLLHSKALV